MEIKYITGLGGGAYIVVFQPTEIEQVLGLGGKVIQVYARNQEEAAKKALRKIKAKMK